MENYSLFISRFIICFVLSFLIGIEREYNNKVGLKINMLVSIGTYLFCAIALKYDDDESVRILAQIISGIGFLGAGSIVTNDNEVRGLTTAATIWCVTAITILVSFGLVIESIVGVFTVLFINLIFKGHTSNNRMLNEFDLRIKCSNDVNEDYLLLPLKKCILSFNTKKYLFNHRFKVISLKLKDIDKGIIENFIKNNRRNNNIRSITYNQS